MTRVSGTNIIKSPCCGALMGTPAYSSINFRAWEYWTDGHADGSLTPSGGGLRRCLCGQCFLLSTADHVGKIWKLKPPAPPGWERRKDNWWNRLWGRETREQIYEHYDIRPAAEIDAEQRSIPPSPEHVDGSELAALISGGLADLQVEEVVRRLYWRHLNAPIRETYRTFRENNKDVDAAGNSSAFPDFHPTPEQTENMLRLIELIKASEAPGWLELAELYRELGDMDAASHALSCITGEKETLHDMSEKLIALNARCPVRFSY